MPPNISINFAVILSRQVTKYPENILERMLVSGYAFLDGVRNDLRVYPPPVPREVVRYYRSGMQKGDPYFVDRGYWPRSNTLKNSWEIHPSITRAGSAGYELRNDAQDDWGRFYADWVQGSHQAHWHGWHGWRTVNQVLEARGGRRKFRAEIQSVIDKYYVKPMRGT